jgi:hypothetical protein
VNDDQDSTPDSSVTRLRIERGGDGRPHLVDVSDLDRDDSECPLLTTEGAILRTDTDPQTGTETNADQQPTDKPEWPRWATNALHQVDAAVGRAVRFVMADPEGAARLAAATLGTVLFAVLAMVLVTELVGWAVDGNPLQDLAAILPAREIATDALMHWLSIHTAGTGISTETAAWTWGITGLVVWVTASCHQLGAQLVLWPAYGAASVAMAWLGTTTATQRPVAAAIVAIAWAALSLFALNRRPRPRLREYVVGRPVSEEASR